MNLCAAEIHTEPTEFLSVWSALSRSARASQHLPKMEDFASFRMQMSLFAYLHLDYSKHFWLKVNLDLEAKPAGSWAAAVLEWCSIHSRGREECVCAPFLCACIYVRLLARTNGRCDIEEKAHLSQHALETSRGQPAVQVFSNEERGRANRSSLPMRRPQLPANQTREVQRSDGQNWWEE